MKLKRFAPLMILLAIVTMGGVFAAWSYANNHAGHAVSTEMGFSMEGTTSQTAYGSYAITVSGKAFTIDQTAVDNYAPLLKINQALEITVRFTPKQDVGVSNDILTNGLDSNLFFDFNQAATQPLYEGKEIILLSGETVKIKTIDDTTYDPENDLQWTKDGDSFIVKLGADFVAKHVSLNTGFVLDSIEDYYAFAACLDPYTCALVVQDPASVTSN